jgi:hypothetical protein
MITVVSIIRREMTKQQIKSKGKKLEVWNSSLYNFLHSPVAFSRFQIFSQTPCSQHLQSPFLGAKDQVPHSKTGNI